MREVPSSKPGRPLYFCSHLSGLNLLRCLLVFELVSSRLALGVCSFFVTGVCSDASYFLASVRIHWSVLGSVWSRRVPPQGRATPYLTSRWGPATKGGLALDQLGRPRARRQASTTRGLAASPKGIAPQTREREELTMRRALRTTPLSQERVGGESEEPAQPECWRGRRAWRGHRAGTAPGQEEQRESCRSSTQRARPRGTRNVLGRTSRPECSRRKIREDWQEG